MVDTAQGRRKAVRANGLYLLAPSIAGVLLFVLLPLGDVIRRSFFNDGSTTFVGADNYIDVLGSNSWRLAATNMLAFAAVSVPLLLFLSLGAALLLQKATPVRALAKSALLIPLALPIFTTTLIVSLLFDPAGVTRDALAVADGFGSLLSGDFACFLLAIALFLWKNLGLATILWLAALLRIPKGCLEAATLEGASRWQLLRHIKLPLVGPAAALISVLAASNTFKIYREVYLLWGNYPPNEVFIIPHAFSNWLSALSLGKLAAATVLLVAFFAIILCLAAAAVHTTRKLSR